MSPLVLLLVSLPLCVLHQHCPSHVISQLLKDYMTSRDWDQAVLFLPELSGCVLQQMTHLVQELSVRGVHTSLLSTADPHLPSSLGVTRHSLGAVVLGLEPGHMPAIDAFLEQVSHKMLFSAYLSWFIVLPNRTDDGLPLEDRVRYLNVGLDSDLVLTTMPHDSRFLKDFVENKASVSIKGQGEHSQRLIYPDLGHSEDHESYYDYSLKVSGERHTFNISKVEHVINRRDAGSSREQEHGQTMDRAMSKDTPTFSLYQMYKIKTSVNSSLVVRHLGVWDPVNGTAYLQPLVGVELRTDFQGHPLTVGVKNSTAGGLEAAAGGGGDVLGPKSVTDDDEEGRGTHNLLAVLEFVSRFLNASYELVPYSKLGWRNEEGAWLYMLGDIVHGALDLGLEDVIITQERAKDLFFSYPIVQSMRNIYFKRPDTSAMRDIFLAPFGPRLVMCVAVTGVVLALAVIIVTNMREGPLHQGWGLGEAAIWSVSVLCMQGSPWSPKTPSGNLVLIFSLMFALIIYNAYAAFIISVLSVHATPIKGLQDLLDSDFDFGYTLGGQDENFLRTVNDTILRRLYFRGLVHSHGVQQASVGLHRASQGDYAFFISARTARRALGSFIAHDKRCDIVELAVEATRSSVALPMSWTSPYRRVINLSLLSMRESGALSLVQNQMLAPMPYCQVYSTFNSARLSDVYSAFLLLGIGLLVGLVGGVAEATWSRHRCARPRGLAKPEHRGTAEWFN